MLAFTRYFAQIAGMYLIILGLILAVRKRAVLDLMPKLAESQPFIFFAGMVRIIVGLGVLVGNGPWGPTAIQIVVALIGWVTLLRGVAMLLVTTRQEQRLIEFWRRDANFYIAIAIVLALGAYLAAAGFAA